MTHGIDRDRIWNIDETSAALLHFGVAGWTRKGSSGSRKLIGDKRACTVLAALRFVPSQLLSQVIFAGKTSASLTSDAPRPNIMTSITESHRTSQESRSREMR